MFRTPLFLALAISVSCAAGSQRSISSNTHKAEPSGQLFSVGAQQEADDELVEFRVLGSFELEGGRSKARVTTIRSEAELSDAFESLPDGAGETVRDRLTVPLQGATFPSTESLVFVEIGYAALEEVALGEKIWIRTNRAGNPTLVIPYKAQIPCDYGKFVDPQDGNLKGERSHLWVLAVSNTDSFAEHKWKARNVRVAPTILRSDCSSEQGEQIPYAGVGQAFQYWGRTNVPSPTHLLAQGREDIEEVSGSLKLQDILVGTDEGSLVINYGSSIASEAAMFDQALVVVFVDYHERVIFEPLKKTQDQFHVQYRVVGVAQPGTCTPSTYSENPTAFIARIPANESQEIIVKDLGS